MGTRPGRERLLGLLLATSASFMIAPGVRAHQPPRKTQSQRVSEFSRRVEAHASGCKELARQRGVFGSVDVRFTTGTRFTVRATKSLGPGAAACVTRAMREMLAEEQEFPFAGAGEGERRNQITLWLGEPVANLPEPARLLPAWKAARAGNPQALRALLPPDVAVTKTGCLSPDGSAIQQGVQLWLARWTKPVAYKWDWLFRPFSSPRFIDPAWFVAHDGDSAYCLVPLDEARERELRTRMNEMGACWQGTVGDLLRAPRIAFPADHTYRSVSLARDRACAVDEAGALTCCGSPKPEPTPAGVFKSVSVGRVHACAIRSDDTIVCWNAAEAPALPPFPGRYTAVVVGEGTACARLLDGHFDCRGKVTDIWRDDVRQVSLDWVGHCLVRRSGALECASTTHELWPPPKNVIAVDANGTLCVLVAGGEVLCPQSGRDGPWGLVSRERFKDIAVTSEGGCGRRQDDTVGCWGRVAGPKGRFRLLEGGDTQMCGIRDDGRIVCWGNPENGYFWPDLSP